MRQKPGTGSIEGTFEAFTALIPYGIISEEEALANARLIGAAPELLAAAKAMVHFWSKHTLKKQAVTGDQCIAALKAAIASTEGPKEGDCGMTSIAEIFKTVKFRDEFESAFKEDD